MSSGFTGRTARGGAAAGRSWSGTPSTSSEPCRSAGLPDPFTTADLAQALRRPRRLAQQATYCLRVAEVIDVAGKQRNSIAYRLMASRDGAIAPGLYDPAMDSPLRSPSVDRAAAGPKP
jgi:hypothetical protein